MVFLIARPAQTGASAEWRCMAAAIILHADTVIAPEVG